MDVETALKLLDELCFRKTEKYLLDNEKNVFKETWQSQEAALFIAKKCNLSESTIKQYWSNWWKILSEELKEPVTKANYQGAFERLALRTSSRRVAFSDFYYVERPPVEERCYEAIEQPGGLIRIKAPQQMGKTFLLQKVLDYARKNSYHTVEFKFGDRSILVNEKEFFREFCKSVSMSLNLENRIDDFWENRIVPNSDFERCNLYFKQYLLSEIGTTNLVLALDNFEVLFDKESIFQSFCQLLRQWHENAKPDDENGKIWRKLRLVIANSTERYPKLDINHSPFNVGIGVDESIGLRGFTEQQVKTLMGCYKVNISEQELETLIALVGGHPYLIQQSLSALKNNHTIQELLEGASTEGGIFISHLRKILENLENSQLKDSYKKVIEEDEVKLDSKLSFKLHSLGLIKFKGDYCVSSCDLYRQYFSARL
jgi:AAA-like domain